MEITSGIYVQTAAAYLNSLSDYDEPDPERLKQIAKRSRWASKYPLNEFGLDIKFNDEPVADTKDE